jgi:hypothetical protein
VWCEQIHLLRGLDRHEVHGRSLHCFRDALKAGRNRVKLKSFLARGMPILRQLSQEALLPSAGLHF